MPEPTQGGGAGGGQPIIIQLIMDAKQPKQEIKDVETRASSMGRSITRALGGGGGAGGIIGGGLPSPIASSVGNVLGTINQLGTAQMGAMVQAGAQTFLGQGAGQLVAGVRETLGGLSAEAAAGERLGAIASDFAKQGIPLDADFLRRTNDIIYAQEQAGQAAGRLAADVSLEGGQRGGITDAFTPVFQRLFESLDRLTTSLEDRKIRR